MIFVRMLFNAHPPSFQPFFPDLFSPPRDLQVRERTPVSLEFFPYFIIDMEHFVVFC